MRRRATATVLAAFAAASYLCLLAGTASAAVVTDRPLLFTFDGSDTTAGKLTEPRRIAVDNSSGSLYATDQSPDSQHPSNRAVSKFNPNGTAANFSATGTSSLLGTPTGLFPESGVHVAVDNSGGPNQGRLYVAVGAGQRLAAFGPDGSFLWELSDLGFTPSDVAVDPAGQPWLYGGGSVSKFDDTGSSNAPVDSFSVSGTARALDIDAGGNFYVSVNSELRKYVGGVLDSTIASSFTPDVFVDQSVPGGHAFAVHASLVPGFNEYDSSGTLLATYGASSIYNGQAIAYNPALDRVYVGDSRLRFVQAYGPEATGTTPDPTIDATVVLGSATAEFHGTVNPQSVPNAYYFEWSNFERVFRTPAGSLPADGVSHAVTFKATNLLGNVNTRVRLVAVNTDTGLRTASAFDQFTPPKATQPPDVTIDDPTPLTPTSERITGTVNPHEDSTRWRPEISTNPDCSPGSFSGGGLRLEYLPGGEVNTPVPVEASVKDLLPAQRYCVRIRANNSFDLFGAGSFSEVKEFTTAAIPPTDVQTAYAGPRTDTTARINGRVNPQGQADLTYHFEVSADGINWTALPQRTSTVDSRVQIVVAEELTGLAPETTYHYRLVGAENEAGAATSTGEVRTFTTRSSAEMVVPERGYELVNNPDKGNQNAFVPGSEMQVSPITADGDKALWGVVGGAPGGYNGSGSLFLAERTPGGWQSRSLPPPAAQQVGGGSFSYQLDTATPDFSWFVFSAKPSTVLGDPGQATRVRLDAHQNQNVLKSYAWQDQQYQPAGLEMTDDGQHVLAINPDNEQIEDLGTGLGSPEVISVMPDGSEADCGMIATQGANFAGGNRAYGPGPRGAAFQWRFGSHFIDIADASLVYFQTQASADCNGSYGLYLRNRDTDETILVDPGTGGKDVSMIKATPDGRRAVFATYSRLDPADANQGVDLYRWDLDSGESTCLSCAVPNASIEHSSGGFSPILVSDDLSHAYFESSNQLVAGEGQPGQRSIYVLSGGEVRYVAPRPPGGFDSVLGSANALVSNDGNVLLFRAAASRQLTADVVQAQAGDQLYLYDDRTGGLECLSCARDGVTTSGVHSEFRMSEDGSVVAFGAAAALVRLDVNRDADVYEWRNGSRRLVTNGLTEFPSEFAGPLVQGMDADGDNILFSVTDPGLTGFEEDGLANLYVARIGGGFVPPNPPATCSGDACQGPLELAPGGDSPGTSTFVGPGNPPPASPRTCRAARRRVRIARRRLRRADTRRERRSARTKLRRARRQLRRCRRGGR